MYRVVNIDDPETYPGTFGDNIEAIHVVSSLSEAELEISALENTDKRWASFDGFLRYEINFDILTEIIFEIQLKNIIIIYNDQK